VANGVIDSTAQTSASFESDSAGSAMRSEESISIDSENEGTGAVSRSACAGEIAGSSSLSEEAHADEVANGVIDSTAQTSASFESDSAGSAMQRSYQGRPSSA
jgi:hypothetical protein